MSRKPPTSHRRTIRTSRWRAAARAAVWVPLAFAGLMMTQEPGTPEASAEYWDVVGTVAMALFGGLFVLWFPAIVIPDRLMIGDDGFVLRTFWRGNRVYRWEDIARVWMTERIQFHTFVHWSNKVDGTTPRRPTYKIDGTLPNAGFWTVPNTQIVKAMRLAKGRYERRGKQAG